MEKDEEVVEAYFKVLSQLLSVAAEENHENTVEIAGLRSEIRRQNSRI
jgi:hypothetical protein